MGIASHRLKIQVTPYVQNNGRQVYLITLHGTVPIQHRGNTYHIPIRIWLANNYPKNAPTLLVTPTPEMAISSNQHVDQNGTVYLPYLRDWAKKYPRVSLQELLAYASSEFSAAPPVYAKAKPRNYQPPQYQETLESRKAKKAMEEKQRQERQEMEKRQEEKKNKDTLLVKAKSLVEVEFSKYNTEITKEIDGLLSKQTILDEGPGKIDASLERLDEEKTRLEELLSQIEKKTEETKEWVEKNESKDKIDINKAVFMNNTWSKQLIEAVAEDHAIDDTLDCLDKALADDTLAVDEFLKHTRKLARKQFNCRALAMKILEAQAKASGRMRHHSVHGF